MISFCSIRCRVTTTLSIRLRRFTAGAFCLLCSFLLVPSSFSQVPQIINYQGRVTVNGVNFEGRGNFKFALVDEKGSKTFWSNDLSSSSGSEPKNGVTLDVSKGLYAVLLGDGNLEGMKPIPPGVFDNPDVRLRVWFDDGSNGSQQLTPDQRIAAVGYAVIAGNVPDGAITGAKIAAGAVQGSNIAPGAIGSGQLAPGAAAGNLGASGQSGVASGGLVLSATENPALVAAGYVRLGSITTGDAWQQRPRGVPGARAGHTAVWTGSEMIVWGGVRDPGSTSVFNDGARFSPVTNSWVTLSPVGAPNGRRGHTAVWTGSEMIVWGGGDSNATFGDGGRYNPISNNWTVVTSEGAPGARGGHTAVWTGSEMIVWGGTGSTGFLGDGKRYNPTNNAWADVVTTGAPGARFLHTAVWTGSEMIVWGGYGRLVSLSFLGDGMRYNPTSNSWAVVASAGAPTARSSHAAVWTGSEMIVWGGGGDLGDLGDGARYNPTSNNWAAVSSPGAPSARSYPAAVWTGSEMIVWGGRIGAGGVLGDGARYKPTSNTWATLASAGAPAARNNHTAVWTGSEMIVWGGRTDLALFGDGGRYNPASNNWAVGAPAARYGHSAVWTGSEMIVWGGYNDYTTGFRLDGGRYNPSSNTWTVVSGAGAPAERYRHTAVWTGSEMIVWGGGGSGGLGGLRGDGGRYNPANNNWAAVASTGAPAARWYHTAVWTGSEMIIWGGAGGSDGRRYNPTTDSWAQVATAGAPADRAYHVAVWTGSEMIIWGGRGVSPFNDGARYNPTSNTWATVASAGAPAARLRHTAVWTGSEMIVWGGEDNGGYLVDGGRYNPAGNNWTSLVSASGTAPAARSLHTSVWTGSEMIIWGGRGSTGPLGDGGRYNPTSNNWPAMSSVGAPAGRTEHTAVWTGSEMILWGGVAGAIVFDDTFSYTPGGILYLYQRP